MKFSKYAYFAAGIMLMMSSCSDFEPTGYTESPELPTVETFTLNVGGAAKHEINLAWTLPSDDDITGCILYRNAREVETFELNPTRSYTYTALGTALGEEVVYTVKVTYNNGYISTGKSVSVTLPSETFAPVTNLKGEVNGRNVTLTWNLPDQAFRTGIRITTNGETDRARIIDPDATSVVLKAQPMEQTLTYTVDVVYDTYYYSEGCDVSETIPYVEPGVLFLLPDDAATWRDMPDDDELAAATWFSAQDKAEFVHASDLAEVDPSLYPVLWIMVDRQGIGLGWQNLPGGIASDATIDALRDYTANGGNLYLSNMATQLTVPLNIVPENMAPTVFGDGAGGVGSDVWTINPYLGWDYREGADQGFYDRTDHAVFKGLTLEDPNGYGYDSLPLIGPGQREDHNCLWDCNLYGRGSFPDVIRNFEDTTNSLVLATWGHVRDHCVAGLVEFYSNGSHGNCIANGFAAYEWNQNSNPNPYQGNIEQLTLNILNYLKGGK